MEYEAEQKGTGRRGNAETDMDKGEHKENREKNSCDGA